MAACQGPLVCTRLFRRCAQNQVISVIHNGVVADVEVRFDAVCAPDRPVTGNKGIGTDADSVLVAIFEGHHIAKRDESAAARRLVPLSPAEILPNSELQ